MKRVFALGLSVLLCLFLFSACTAEKTIEDHVDLAMAQLGKPTADAYRDMGLPGNPEDTIEGSALLVRDCYDVFGKQLGVEIFHRASREKGKELTEVPTDCVTYAAMLDGDYEYAVRLYEALREAYGEPEPVAGSQPFTETTATVDWLKALGEDEYCAGLWRKDDNEIEFHVSNGTVSKDHTDPTIGLEIKIPIERLYFSPIYTYDGTRIR